MDEVDLENVCIGKWNSSIPSEICMNKDIFNEIFSTETLYKVLMPDQRERILHLLPPEVLETSGAAQQTMEDLFARTLTRFEANPIDTFFTQLEQGRYDPNVVQTKKALYKAWKKDAVRKRKKYHVKLLQDIVVSRERLLQNQDLDSTILPLTDPCPSSSSIIVNNNKEDDIFLTNQVNDSSNSKSQTSLNSGSPSSNKNVNNLDTMVDKIYREEISAINRQVGSFSSSDDESPPKKTAKVTKKSFTKSKPKANKSAFSSNKLNPSTNDSIVLDPTLSNIPLTTATVPKVSHSPQVTIKIPTTVAQVPAPSRGKRDEQTAAQMAKFPKILPAPAVTSAPLSSMSTTNLSPLLASLNSPVASLPNHSNLSSNSATKTTQASKVATSTFLSNPTKSSPILASQLQSVTLLPSSNHNCSSPASTSTPSKKSSFKFNSATSSNIKVRHSSEDELESSSDDEFEAVEPTVKFTPASSKSLTNKNSNSKSANATSSRSSQQQSVTSPKSNDTPWGSSAKPKTTVCVSTPKGIIAITTTNVVTQQAPAVKYSTVQLTKLLQSQPQVVSSGQTAVLQPQSSVVQTQLQLPQPQTTSFVQPKLNVKVVTPAPASVNQPVKSFQVKTALPVSNTISSICSTVAVSPNVQPVVQTSSTNRTPKPTPAVANPVTVPKLIPITVSIQQGVKSPSLRPIVSLATHSAGSASGITLNGPVNNILSLSGSGVTVADESSSPLLNSTAITSSQAGLQMFSLLSQPNVNVMDTLGEDVNLNLGLSINMNNLTDAGVVGGDDDVAELAEAAKFTKIPEMEKIDDLSVLEGNPFDSIPNLSDELDGLDLDIVDGLCDFEGLLSEEKQYASFFSLIRDVLCSTRDHRMTLICLEKTIRKWSMCPTAALNTWFLKVNDWNEALITALNFLAGNYQDAHPEDFVPYIEYKYKTKYYQWIGAGRDGDNNLTPLCNMWLENVDRLPSLRKLEADGDDIEEDDDDNEDSDGPGEEPKKKAKRALTPPPPRCVTDWSVRPSTQMEKDAFQIQERQRFENPHKAFTYQIHGYESVVGPVKGVYSSQSGMTNKARGHSLLVDDRPPYVTILALVRDAVARLPNGEGTRSEICEMLRDSAFLAPEASSVTLNSVVSGALDRLHYERDPCVRYDSHKKSWVYLHRDRTQEQFERLHHNRSYTKSTKSRNSSARKARKHSSRSASQSSSPGSSTSSKDLTPTTSVSVAAPAVVINASAVTTAATIPISATKLPPVGTLIAKTSRNQAQPVLQITGNMRQGAAHAATGQQKMVQAKHAVVTSTNATGEVKQILVDSSAFSSATAQIVDRTSATGMRKLPLSEVLAAASLGSTIRFAAIPNASGVVAATGATGSMQLTTTGDPSSGIVFRTAGTSNLGSALTGNTGNLVSSQAVALQVQTVSTSNTGAIATAKAPTATLTVSQANTIASTANTGLVLNSPAVIRLANSIRLPEGVRFAQVRLPLQHGTQQSLGSNPVRLPQQRIILTRAALTGQAQTQGVLLGQTPSGQTVILSTTPGALSHLQGSQIPFTITTSQASVSMENQLTNSVTTTNAITNMMANPVAVSMSSGIPKTGTMTVIANNTDYGTPDKSLINMGTSGATDESPGSIVVSTAGLVPTSGTHTMIPISQAHYSNTNLLQQVSATQHIVTQMANQLQQQSSQSGNPSAGQLTSPIIIRSQQGDFVIPGHISLGRGVQGIKVIPVPAGKQTVLARIVAPTSVAQTASPSASNTQTTSNQQS